MPTTRRGFILTATVATAATVVSAPRRSHAAEPEIFSEYGAAIRRADPVAFFTEGKPVEGSDSFEYRWKGARWLFASAANRDAFIADPEAYAPQYGGYCAYTVARGKLAPIDPSAWQIVDGKLYLNFNQSVLRRWRRDIPGNIANGDANWPDILESN